MEVELAGEELVLAGPFHEVCRCQVFLRVIVAVAALVAGYEIFVGGHLLGEPAVAAGVFEVPGLGFVHKGYAEAFGAAVFFNQLSEAEHSFAGAADVGEDDLEHAVFGQASFYIGVEVQDFFL